MAKQRTDHEMGAPEPLTEIEHPKTITNGHICTAVYSAVVRLKPLQLHVHSICDHKLPNMA